MGVSCVDDYWFGHRYLDNCGTTTKCHFEELFRCYEWHSVKMEMPENSESENGSIEAGLAFIPTTAFFLLVMQLVISGSFQVVETMKLQSAVTKTALGKQWALTDDSPQQRAMSLDFETLPGGGELLLANSQISTPQISNLIGLRPKVKSQALAISE